MLLFVRQAAVQKLQACVVRGVVAERGSALLLVRVLGEEVAAHLHVRPGPQHTTRGYIHMHGGTVSLNTTCRCSPRAS